LRRADAVGREIRRKRHGMAVPACDRQPTARARVEIIDPLADCEASGAPLSGY